MKRDIKKSIRLSEDENLKLNQMLEEHNISFSDYARARLLKYKIKTNITQDLLYEVNRIGNNLNQIAKKVNSYDDDAVEQLQALVGIEKELKRLVDGM
jgi:membrane peptidoglycan carboxypeptidase